MNRAATVPSPEALLTSPERYALIENIDHAAIMGPINTYLKKLTPITIGYGVVVLAGFVAWFVAMVNGMSQSGLWPAVQPFLGLFIGAFVLIPVHELIHIIAYRLCGARQATMQFDPKTLVALAVADRFVATGRQFYVIAAAPSVVLCGLCVLVALLVPSVAFVCIGAFAAHAMAALGDWALFNLAWLNRDAEVYTFDDVAARRTYFFRRSHPH
jgi:hypothetical protein